MAFGKTASSEQAQEMHLFVQQLLKDLVKKLQKELHYLMAGIVNQSNTNELFANKDVDGGLIGGASLKAEDFLGIINGF